MPNEFPNQLTLARSVELPARLVAMLAATQVSEPKTPPEADQPAPFVHPPADAETRAWNAAREAEWEAAHVRFEHQPADGETRRWNQQREAEWHAEVDAVEHLLRELCPLAFCDPPVPLKIGIDRDLVALLAGEADEITIVRFLRGWTRRPAYRDAIRRGGPRHDLDGCACGEVTAREGRRGGTP